MPFAAGSADGPAYYSYNVGPVHVLALNSFGTYNSGSPQYTFALADLAAVDRAKTPWVIVSLHAPWYNSNTQHQTDGLLMRETFESAFVSAGVAAVVAGHVHAYERTVPVAGGSPSPKGIVHLNVGDAGSPEGLYTKWTSPQPTWSAYRDAEYGHGEITFLNATHAAWAWVRNIDNEPVAADSAVIVNPWRT
jgi:hypothetical protein